MGGHIGHNLRRCFCLWHFLRLPFCTPHTPGRRTLKNIFLQTASPAHKSSFLNMHGRALNRVSGIVTENSHIFIQQRKILLQGRHCPALHRRFLGCPGLSEKNFLSFAIFYIQASADLVHQLHIQKPHQIKTKSVYVVFLCPVQN